MSIWATLQPAEEITVFDPNRGVYEAPEVITDGIVAVCTSPWSTHHMRLSVCDGQADAEVLIDADGARTLIELLTTGIANVERYAAEPDK